MTKAVARKRSASPAAGDCSGLVGSISGLLDAARRASVRTVNAFMTATCWEIGRRIVEFEQGGLDRAKYGESVVERLAKDLSSLNRLCRHRLHNPLLHQFSEKISLYEIERKHCQAYR